MMAIHEVDREQTYSLDPRRGRSLPRRLGPGAGADRDFGYRGQRQGQHRRRAAGCQRRGAQPRHEQHAQPDHRRPRTVPGAPAGARTVFGHVQARRFHDGVLDNVLVRWAKPPRAPSMKAGGVAQTVTVTTETPAVNRADDGVEHDRREHDQVDPILGRKFEDLLTLTPGVSIAGTDATRSTSRASGVFNISLDGGDYQRLLRRAGGPARRHRHHARRRRANSR